MYEEIGKICSIAGTTADESATKVIIMSGAGEKSFAAGTDIGSFIDFKTAEDGLHYESRMESVIEKIETCKVPVIAALHGVVTGGGLIIASAAHLRLASTSVKAGMPIARTLGNCLSLKNLRRLVTLFGESRVAHMILTAELFEAKDLMSGGFVHEVLEDKDTLINRAEEVADSMKLMAPLTISASIEGLNRIRNSVTMPSDEDLISKIYRSVDFKGGVRAFVEKRKPKWQGK